jgi:hypothetical protein
VPADIDSVGRDNADFIQLEPQDKIFFLMSLIPAEQALDHRAHRLKVESPREIEIPGMRRAKAGMAAMDDQAVVELPSLLVNHRSCLVA